MLCLFVHIYKAVMGPREAWARGVMEGLACAFCGRCPQRAWACGRCHQAVYCSRECQRGGWREGHRDVCRAPSAAEGEAAGQTRTITMPAAPHIVLKAPAYPAHLLPDVIDIYSEALYQVHETRIKPEMEEWRARLQKAAADTDMPFSTEAQLEESRMHFANAITYGLLAASPDTLSPTDRAKRADAIAYFFRGWDAKVAQASTSNVVMDEMAEEFLLAVFRMTDAERAEFLDVADKAGIPHGEAAEATAKRTRADTEVENAKRWWDQQESAVLRSLNSMRAAYPRTSSEGYNFLIRFYHRLRQVAETIKIGFKRRVLGRKLTPKEEQFEREYSVSRSEVTTIVVQFLVMAGLVAAGGYFYHDFHRKMRLDEKKNKEAIAKLETLSRDLGVELSSIKTTNEEMVKELDAAIAAGKEEDVTAMQALRGAMHKLKEPLMSGDAMQTEIATTEQRIQGLRAKFDAIKTSGEVSVHELRGIQRENAEVQSALKMYSGHLSLAAKELTDVLAQQHEAQMAERGKNDELLQATEKKLSYYQNLSSRLLVIVEGLMNKEVIAEMLAEKQNSQKLLERYKAQKDQIVKAYTLVEEAHTCIQKKDPATQTVCDYADSLVESYIALRTDFIENHKKMADDASKLAAATIFGEEISYKVVQSASEGPLREALKKVFPNDLTVRHALANIKGRLETAIGNFTNIILPREEEISGFVDRILNMIETKNENVREELKTLLNDDTKHEAGDTDKLKQEVVGLRRKMDILETRRRVVWNTMQEEQHNAAEIALHVVAIGKKTEELLRLTSEQFKDLAHVETDVMLSLENQKALLNKIQSHDAARQQAMRLLQIANAKTIKMFTTSHDVANIASTTLRETVAFTLFLQSQTTYYDEISNYAAQKTGLSRGVWEMMASMSGMAGLGPTERCLRNMVSSLNAAITAGWAAIRTSENRALNIGKVVVESTAVLSTIGNMALTIQHYKGAALAAGIATEAMTFMLRDATDYVLEGVFVRLFDYIKEAVDAILNKMPPGATKDFLRRSTYAVFTTTQIAGNALRFVLFKMLTWLGTGIGWLTGGSLPFSGARPTDAVPLTPSSPEKEADRSRFTLGSVVGRSASDGMVGRYLSANTIWAFIDVAVRIIATFAGLSGLFPGGGVSFAVTLLFRFASNAGISIIAYLIRKKINEWQETQNTTMSVTVPAIPIFRTGLATPSFGVSFPNWKYWMAEAGYHGTLLCLIQGSEWVIGGVVPDATRDLLDGKATKAVEAYAKEMQSTASAAWETAKNTTVTDFATTAWDTAKNATVAMPALVEQTKDTIVDLGGQAAQRVSGIDFNSIGGEAFFVGLNVGARASISWWAKHAGSEAELKRNRFLSYEESVAQSVPAPSTSEPEPERDPMQVVEEEEAPPPFIVRRGPSRRPRRPAE